MSPKALPLALGHQGPSSGSHTIDSPPLVPGDGWDYCCQPGWCPKPGKGPGLSLFSSIIHWASADHFPHLHPLQSNYRSPFQGHLSGVSTHCNKTELLDLLPCLFLSYLFTFNIPSPLPSLPILSIKITSSLEGLKCLLFPKLEVRCHLSLSFFFIYYAYLQNYTSFVDFGGPL